MIEEIFEYPFLMRIFNNLLTNNEKIKLIQLSSSIKSQRHKLKFNERFELTRKDFNTWYYDLLTDIYIGQNLSKDELNYVLNNFPKYMDRLEFGFYFNEIINFTIPSSEKDIRISF